MGDKQGHEFRGNQWTTGYGSPPTSADPAPGGQYYYHATSISSLEGIADGGLVPPAHSQNAISFAPHLESAGTWANLIGGKSNVLLRVKRDEVDGIETGDEYDPNDESAEVGTYREVQPEVLQVFHQGEWKDLIEHVYSPQFRAPAEKVPETSAVQSGDYRRGTPENPIKLEALAKESGPVGPVHVEVYRVGAFADVNDKPLMDGRGLFFAESAESAKEYEFGHKGHEVTKYTVSAKSAYVSKSQFTLSKEFLGKSLQDAVYAEDKKLMKIGRGDTIVANRIVEEKIFKKIRAKGHDAVILTDPPAPAKLELAVIKKTADIRSKS